jgi:hypothetical protein
MPPAQQYQTVLSKLMQRRGHPPELAMCNSLDDAETKTPTATALVSNKTTSLKAMEQFLTFGSDVDRMQDRIESLQRELTAAKGEAAEEHSARKAAEERAMVLRRRLAEAGSAEQGFREVPGQGAEAAAGAAAAQGMCCYRSLMERNPFMVDSFWIPVDDGVMVCPVASVLFSLVLLMGNVFHLSSLEHDWV